MDGCIRLGVSACLLGQAVRYDGGHKRDAVVVELLGGGVEWVPVCPELESGLGVPRPPMRLERPGREVRLLETRSRVDHTARMRRFSARRVRALRALELCGYVLKQDSPSCGMARVKLYAEGGARRTGRGLFADALMQALPLLPVEEEGRLADAALRESFIERVFAYRRLRALFRGRWTVARVGVFHAAHELQLLAHSRESAAELARLAASAARLPRARFRSRYESSFMAALGHVATRAGNTRALRLAARRLAPRLDAAARAALNRSIDGYRAGRAPLVTPITQLRHLARDHRAVDLVVQTFLEPESGDSPHPAN